MQLFEPSIIHIDPNNFNPEVHHQINQLGLSTDLSSILQTLKDGNQGVWYIYGEPGSGCTTLVQGLCQHLCQSNTITESDLLYLSLNQSCSQELFCDFMTKLAKHRNGTALLNKSSVTTSELKEDIAKFLQENFKVICIDNADLCGNFIDVFLADVLKACKLTCFVVFNQTKQHGPHSNDFASAITVHGLSHSAGKALVSNELLPLTLPEDEISNLCKSANANPAAIKLVCGLLNGQPENISSVLQDVSTASSIQSSCSMDMILQLISKFLKKSNIGVLYSLCSLRQPLPMLDVPPAIKELIQVKLLTVTQEGDVQWISPNSTITMKKYLQRNEISVTGEPAGIDVLALWLSLMSHTLQKLIDEAEDNAWPFVPERWQYIKDVNEKESYNIKELITANNTSVSSMTEYQILQEGLYHAYMQADYKKLAAITFVLDRFLYWSGDTKTTMDVLDFIQTNSPETAIAPQMVIRRARFMKNEGNLRGAEETLDSLLQARTKIGQWKYRQDHEYMLVSGVCVQIKGDIQYSLGHWPQAASLLVRSIQFFGSLPQPDKKGLSSSYGLLSLCFRNMTMYQFYQLAHSHGLLQCHPLLAAYFSALEASKLCVYTPMFFLRHSCQAGENMLDFANLATTHYEKKLYLKVAIEDLKDSIQAHQTYKSLTSREQFYILVCACYKISLALMQLESAVDQTRGQSLKKLSLKLYEHYCCSTIRVVIDDKISSLVDKCLNLLQLVTFSLEDLPNAGQLLSNHYTRRSEERLAKKTCLVSVELFAKIKPLSSMPLGFDSPKEVISEQVQESMASNIESDEVDRCAATVEVEEDVKEKLHLSKTEEVDRCATTVDFPEEEEIQKSKTIEEFALLVGQTETDHLHSSVIVQSLEDEAVSLPSQTHQIPLANNDQEQTVTEQKGRQAKDAILWKYDYTSRQWRRQPTIVYIGDLLKLDKGQEGKQRDVYTVEFINQDEPLAKYVAKTYRKERNMQQYTNDVLSQMTARHYVAMFNQCLAGAVGVGEIQFLPVVLLQLVDSSGHVTQVFNAEPYMSGEFTKLTNNAQWKDEKRQTDLVLAYSHFTYQASDRKLIIVDIQGWTPHDNKGCTYLTDPQVHSSVYRCFGTGNFKKKGFENFWKMHSECNEICHILNLIRPPNK